MFVRASLRHPDLELAAAVFLVW